jgi:hypothetical protein
MSDNPSGNKTGASGESQSAAAGNNKARGNNKSSSPGMIPGIGQQGDNAARSEDEGEDRSSGAKSDKQEQSDLEQQQKEAMTERD